MSCAFHELDGAYVLGSLAPAERADYEQHLAGCAECSAAVRRLAGLPGLLARVPADVLESPPPAVSVPTTLLPSLVHAARRDQRRRQARTLLAAAAAVVVVGAGSAALAVRLAHDEPEPTTSATQSGDRLRMMPVGPGSSSGWISLTEVAWGTRLELDCEYDSPYGGHAAYAYALVVTTTDGEEEQVATWRALPGRELHVTGATAAAPADIAEVEVQDAHGEPVLRLTR